MCSVQYKAVLDGIKRGQGTFNFPGEESLSLNPDVGAFITMNPGLSLCPSQAYAPAYTPAQDVLHQSPPAVHLAVGLARMTPRPLYSNPDPKPNQQC